MEMIDKSRATTSIRLDQIGLAKGKVTRDYFPMTALAIRKATLDDLADLYHVAIKTGDSGSDASGMFRNDDMIGEVFVGPYVTLSTDTCFALSEDGQAIGYGLCVLDTEIFQRNCRETWWPALQEKYRDLATVQDQEWLVKEIFQPTPSPESVLEKFPSHGHIDLLPQVQGQGWGRKMMEAMENRLSELGSPGFHLRVSAYNDRGLKFYSAIGYSELMRRGDEVIVGKELK